MTDAGPAVETRGLSKWFGSATALDAVDLVVERGRIHGLVGPNGAGKTTLLSLLFGLVRPDEGVVRLLGRTRAESGPGWLAGVAGFVEAPRFYPYLSGRRNLLVLAGLDGGEAVSRIDEVIELVQLETAARLKVRGYSLGMRQRLGLAAALLREPSLLILDEPTNGLDPSGVRELYDVLRGLAAEGRTVIMSSHDMTRVSELCDSVTVLANGHVAFSGGLQTLRAQAPPPVFSLTTSDDAAALALAAERAFGPVAVDQLEGLSVTADRTHLDDFVVALGRAGIAVRTLTEARSPLEALYFTLTDDLASTPDALATAGERP